MPYELPLAEVLTLIGILIAQGIGAWRFIDSRFTRLASEMRDTADAQESKMAELAKEVGRIDKEAAGLKERVGALPSKDQISEMLDRKMDKLEAKFDRLHAALLHPRSPRTDTGD